jgi:hypothetical protein
MPVAENSVLKYSFTSPEYLKCLKIFKEGIYRELTWFIPSKPGIYSYLNSWIDVR